MRGFNRGFFINYRRHQMNFSSMRFKLYFAGVVSVGLIGSMASMLLIGRNFYMDTVHHIQDVYLYAAEQAHAARSDVMHARLAMDDFFIYHVKGVDAAATRDAPLVRQAMRDAAGHLEAIGAMRQKLTLPLMGKDSNKDISQHLLQMEDDIHALQQDFQKLVEDWKIRGHVDTGLEGQFRVAAHAIERSLTVAYVDVPSLEVALLQMRRREKDYLLRGDSKYVDLFHENGKILLATMQQHLANSPEKLQHLSALLHVYETTFDQLVQQDQVLLEQTQALEKQYASLNDSLLPLQVLGKDLAALASQELSEFGLYTRNIVMVMVVLFVLFMLWFEIRVIRYMLNRIASTDQAMRQFKHGDLDYRVVVTGKDEFSSLAQSFNQMADELQRSQSELEQFSYVASHDLQEPLRMVSSYTQLLARRYVGKLDEKADKYIHYAVDGAERMQALINDLLAYSRVGRQQKTLLCVNTAHIVETVVRDLNAVIQESGAVMDVADALPDVLGDEVQLRQLFQNIIGNALKYRGEQAPVIKIWAEFKHNMWKFSIQDNGIGIAPEFAERVFQIFQRLHERGKYEGTGLGLAIVKKIVNQHGGKIWVESKEGQGSTFVFTLPRNK